MPRRPEDVSKDFWDSQASIGYPQWLELGGETVIFSTGVDIRMAIGGWMEEEGWIPDSGPILDLGAGPCSGLIYRDNRVENSVFAVDNSELQLGNNPVPNERKLLIDLRYPERFPGEWEDKFSLISFIFTARYLFEQQRQDLYSHCHKLCQKGGRLVVIDGKKTRENHGEIMGEVCDVDHEREAELIQEAGFNIEDHGVIILSFQTLDLGTVSTSPLHFITGIKNL